MTPEQAARQQAIAEQPAQRPCPELIRRAKRLAEYELHPGQIVASNAVAIVVGPLMVRR